MQLTLSPESMSVSSQHLMVPFDRHQQKQQSKNSLDGILDGMDVTNASNNAIKYIAVHLNSKIRKMDKIRRHAINHWKDIMSGCNKLQ